VSGQPRAGAVSSAAAASATAADEFFCSLRAQAVAGDPIGYATPFHNYVIVELPMPWPARMLEAQANGSTYQRIRDSVVRAYERDGPALAAAGRGHRALAVAPDPQWSQPGCVRLWHATRGGEQIAEFDVAEYLLPSEDAAADFAEAAIHDPARLSDFAHHRNDDPARDFFVCTQGTLDVCCGKFGYPLYRHLRERFPGIRVWRAVHFGGHRFAPTAIELPSGHSWAYLDEASADQVVRRAGDVASVARHLRGWAGMTGVAQVADREAFLREGWDWLLTRRLAKVLDSDDATGRAHVRIDFTRPDGSAGAYEAVVGVARTLPEIGCGPELGQHDGRIEEFRVETFDCLPV
jgi:hypothetical protein